jgi:hypothetical protein
LRLRPANLILLQSKLKLGLKKWAKEDKELDPNSSPFLGYKNFYGTKSCKLTANFLYFWSGPKSSLGCNVIKAKCKNGG